MRVGIGQPYLGGQPRQVPEAWRDALGVPEILGVVDPSAGEADRLAGRVADHSECLGRACPPVPEELAGQAPSVGVGDAADGDCIRRASQLDGEGRRARGEKV